MVFLIRPGTRVHTALLVTVVIVAIALPLSSVSATTYTWLGTTSNNWSDGVYDSAELDFNQSATTGVSNSITGAGILTKLNTNSLGLSDSNTFTGTVNVNAGTLVLDNVLMPSDRLFLT